MIVNRKSCDITNIACHFKTDVTKVIHAIMEMEEHSLRESQESEKQRWQKFYGDMIFADDVHEGKLLKRGKVIEARKVEREYFWKVGVYEKVHRSKARGYKVITTRWVDTNRGVRDQDDYRSRLVGRDLNREKRHDLFVPTQPLEAMKALVGLCAKSQDGREPLMFATIDIKRAHFCAPAQVETGPKLGCRNRAKKSVHRTRVCTSLVTGGKQSSIGNRDVAPPTRARQTEKGARKALQGDGNRHVARRGRRQRGFGCGACRGQLKRSKCCVSFSSR